MPLCGILCAKGLIQVYYKSTRITRTFIKYSSKCMWLRDFGVFLQSVEVMEICFVWKSSSNQNDGRRNKRTLKFLIINISYMS